MAEASRPDTQTAPQAPDRRRSPGYPTLSLQDAIEKVRTLYKEDKGAATSPEVIAAHWKTKTNSSTFMQDFASMKRFGLLVSSGTGNWKVSLHAIDILLLPEESPDRAKRIKHVALTPKIFNELWQEYGTDLPSDANLVHKLVTVKGFQPNSAKDVIKTFKKTLTFAKLVNGDKISDSKLDVAPAVGELVQWESQGVAQFPTPRRFMSVSDDGEWAFVEGSLTGIPIAELRRVAPPDVVKEAMMTLAINSPNGGSRPAPAINRRQPPAAPGQKDFALYLSNNQRGALYVPANMTKKDYDLLKRQIENHLMVIEATSIADSGSGDGSGSASGSRNDDGTGGEN